MVTSASWETSSAPETVSLGEALGRSLVGGVTIGLVGSLGSGKTTLVAGIAAGNTPGSGVEVTSPTFTLVHEYPGRLYLYHVDVYRLADVREAAALGFDEWLRPDSVVIVEWADRIAPLLGTELLRVELTATGESSRRLVFDARGELALRCLSNLRTAQG